MKDYEKALEIAEKVHAAGGRAYFVGGFVRDRIMGVESKDIDVEIHGITTDVLENILSSLGSCTSMGESYRIYMLKGYDIDISFPKGADGTADPFIGTYNAAKRRDLTVNALMQDIVSGEVTDHFGGINDIENKVLRHVDDSTFTEDPLRVLRVAQLASRFGFEVAQNTVEICKKTDITCVARERVEQELKKALLKSEKPSVFFEVLKKMNQLGYWFAELEATVGIPQNPVHHAEGDVWTHTMMVVDEGARHKEKSSAPFGFMLACVVHDFGKSVCTEEINGVIHAYGHENAGLTPAKEFLKRFTDDAHIIKYVLNIAQLHMRPNVAAQAGASVKSTNKMFDMAVDPMALICIAQADTYGKISQYPCADNTGFLTERLKIYNEYMSRPYVTGKDLIDAGLEPGKRFSEILEYAHKLRLAGTEKQSALKQALSYGRKMK